MTLPVVSNLRAGSLLRAGAAGLATLLLSTALPAQVSGDPAPGDLWLVSVAHDAVAHRDALLELADLRRARALPSFEARVGALRAEQAGRRSPLVAWIEARGAEVLDEVALTETLIVRDPSGLVAAALRSHPAVRAVERDTRGRDATVLVAVRVAQHHELAHSSVPQVFGAQSCSGGQQASQASAISLRITGNRVVRE